MANPQSWNRFSYVRNNPIKYNDPTGHNEECGIGELGCNAGSYTPPIDQSGSLDRVLGSYGITTEGGTRKEKQAALLGAHMAGGKLTTIFGGTSADNFRKVHGDIHIVFGADIVGCKTVENTITCGTNEYWLQTMIHEYGHVFDYRYRTLSHWDDENPNCDASAGGCLASNYLPAEFQNTDGYFCETLPCLAHDPSVDGYDFTEAFADMYMNWVMDLRGNDVSIGKDKNGFNYQNQSSLASNRNQWMFNNIFNKDAPSGVPVFLWLMGLR